MSRVLNQNLEIEVKFFEPELEKFKERLLAAGARQLKPRIFELNIRFDDEDDRLRKQKKLLRLRQDSTTRLTFKGEPDRQFESEARVLEELEVKVSNFDEMGAILERVGLEKKQVYEKYRETFELESVEIVLDELPFGDFVELEGEEKDIKAAAEKLGLDWNRRILENYLVLMARLKIYHSLPFDDLTFANFEDQNYSIAELFDQASA